MKKAIGIILLGLLAIAFWSGIYLFFGKNFFKIDACLDEGGRWNYDVELCESEYIFLAE